MNFTSSSGRGLNRKRISRKTKPGDQCFICLVLTAVEVCPVLSSRLFAEITARSRLPCGKWSGKPACKRSGRQAGSTCATCALREKIGLAFYCSMDLKRKGVLSGCAGCSCGRSMQLENDEKYFHTNFANDFFRTQGFVRVHLTQGGLFPLI